MSNFEAPKNYVYKPPRPSMLEASMDALLKEVLDKQNAAVVQAYKDGLWASSVERDKVYSERNKLVCALSKLWPSHLAKHPHTDTSWDPNWTNIVIIESPVGQLSWHIMDSELPQFAHLELGYNNWDGHTTEQKYERLADLRTNGFKVVDTIAGHMYVQYEARKMDEFERKLAEAELKLSRHEVWVASAGKLADRLEAAFRRIEELERKVAREQKIG
jgi:hypothetical protein